MPDMATEYVPYTGPIVTLKQARTNGLTRYFTGKPCARGHLSQRRTVNQTCTECEWKKRCRDARNASDRKARERNPESERARVARYLATDKGKANRRAYYFAHIDDIKRRAKEWKEQNPARVLELRRADYAANKARIVQRVAEWNALNPDGPRTRGRNYRAKLYAAEGNHTREEIKALHEKQNGRCVYCYRRLGEEYHADHIVPLSRGGSNWISNIQLTCGPCNNRKRATDPIEYARRIGRLI
jgi:5-methylcytosine-specific restriction endonuclease McrA